MPTIVDTLTQLAQDFRDGVAACRGLRSDILVLFDQKKTEVTTIINNFYGRPAVQVLFVDPLYGDDANDGLTSAKAKKSLDDVLDGLGITGTQIMLMNDVVLRRRRSAYAQLSIYGVQAANNVDGYTFFYRKITFLGSAENSPIAGIGTFPSGLWLLGTNYFSQYIDYVLPDQPAGQDYDAHITSAAGTSISLNAGTLLVGSAAAGALVGAKANRSNVFSSLAFGTGASGHLFSGVAAGANPNGQWAYSSNLTAA